MSNELDANLSVIKAYGEITFLEETGHSLADKVLRKLQDGSYAWSDVVDEFNACLDYLSGKYNLIELEHVEDVTTDANAGYIPMPANYQKNLFLCRSITNNRVVIIDDTVINLYRRYTVLNQSGAVRRVAVKGRYLYYQRLAAEVLRLIYYRYPRRLRTRNDKPNCLPPHLVEPLLVNYALMELYKEIEDGIEGPTPQTDRYTARFEKAEAELVTFLGPQRRAPVEIPDEMQWDAYV